MTVTRTRQGIVEIDAFGSDSRGNYDPLTGPIGYSAGYITLPSGDTMERASLTTATCITARVLSGANYAAGPWIGKNYPLAAAGDADGYCIYGIPSNWGTRRVDNDGVTTLGTGSSGYPAAAAYGVARLFIASGVQFRAGTTALSVTPTGGGDATYSAPFYYGIRSPLAASLQVDWLEARIDHQVTMTGMPAGWWLRTTNSEGTNDIVSTAGAATVDLSSRLFGPSNNLTRVAVWNGDPAGAGVEQDFVTSATYADMGGGDQFAYSVPRASSFSQGRRSASVDLLRPQRFYW